MLVLILRGVRCWAGKVLRGSCKNSILAQEKEIASFDDEMVGKYIDA